MKNLQLGNYIKSKSNTTTPIFKSVDLSDLNWLSENQEEFNKKNASIYLNSIWLRSLGFKPGNGMEFNKWIDEYEVTSLFVNVDKENGLANFIGIACMGKIIFQPKLSNSVHVLQNLYAALTGTMIKIDSLDELNYIYNNPEKYKRRK